MINEPSNAKSKRHSRVTEKFTFLDICSSRCEDIFRPRFRSACWHLQRASQNTVTLTSLQLIVDSVGVSSFPWNQISLTRSLSSRCPKRFEHFHFYRWQIQVIYNNLWKRMGNSVIELLTFKIKHLTKAVRGEQWIQIAKYTCSKFEKLVGSYLIF